MIGWLHTYIKPEGVWSMERVIIFTKHHARQEQHYGALR
jgi:hypothetical protein